MELSTSTNIYFNRPDGSHAPIQDSIRLCGEAGYRKMDMNFHDCVTFQLPFVTDSWHSWLESIQKTAQSSCVRFSQAHAPFYNFCDLNYQNREYMDRMIRRSVDCASALEIPWLVIHAGTAYDTAMTGSVSKSRNREYFLPLIDYASKRNVGIAIENLWEYNIAPLRRYTTCIEELVDLIDSFDDPCVGACCDVDHITLSGQDQRDSILAIGHRLKATHISDCINIDSDHNIPFFGKTDWSAIMQALKEIHYQGDFTYEMHRWTANMPTPLVPAALRYSVEVGNFLLSL